VVLETAVLDMPEPGKRDEGCAVREGTGVDCGCVGLRSIIGLGGAGDTCVGDKVVLPTATLAVLVMPFSTPSSALRLSGGGRLAMDGLGPAGFVAGLSPEIWASRSPICDASQQSQTQPAHEGRQAP
jgi:hypothetical protein